MLYLLFIVALSVDESKFNDLTIYEIMLAAYQDGDPTIGYGIGYGPSMFKGDLQGVINGLEYIKSLGVNAIWLTPPFDCTYGQGGPVLQSSGYFSTNYFKIDPNFGTEATFRKLVEKAHSLGLYVFLDGVFGHHGGVSTKSPNGNMPVGSPSYATYPDSLPYYAEVAQYWINEFEIDGWRLDQVIQLNQNGHNYMKEIREAIYAICDRRKQAGKTWGTLGYIVGEEWDGVEAINMHTYSGDGLRSAFDFNSRYYLVQGAAQEESGKGGFGIETFANIHRTPQEKGYINGVYPNLFVSNHDTWRFGNLVRARHNVSVDDDLYWKIHKMAIAALAIYTGPITFFYGDEYGDITSCWYGNREDCGPTTFSDNCGRTDDKIDNFNDRQTDLIQFTRKMLKVRNEHTSMTNGNYSRFFDKGDLYINIKSDQQNNDQVLYATTLSSTTRFVQINATKDRLVDVINGEVISNIGGKFSLTLNPYETRVFTIEDNIPDEKSAQENRNKKKRRTWLIVAGCAGLVLLIVLIILIVQLVKSRSKKSGTVVDDQDPLLENDHGGYTGM